MPPPASPPGLSVTAPLSQRLLQLAQTLQFAWFVGHLAHLFCTVRYSLSYLTFNYYSTWAQLSYRTAFVAAAVTYGIVVYKAYRARARNTSKPTDLALSLVGDENIQYLGMSLVWLFSKQIPLALLPFTVYSIFHVATYTRTFLIPAILSSPQSPGAAPGGKSSSKNSPLGENIGKFVKEYYEPSMSLVALLEVALWFRLFGSALIFQKGSWVLLLIYSIFFRARFSQSNFVQEVVKMASSRIDVQVASQSTPPLARQAWAAFKNGLRQLHDVTDARKYFPGPTVNGAGQKKGQ